MYRINPKGRNLDKRPMGGREMPPPGPRQPVDPGFRMDVPRPTRLPRWGQMPGGDRSYRGVANPRGPAPDQRGRVEILKRIMAERRRASKPKGVPKLPVNKIFGGS